MTERPRLYPVDSRYEDSLWQAARARNCRSSIKRFSAGNLDRATQGSPKGQDRPRPSEDALKNRSIIANLPNLSVPSARAVRSGPAPRSAVGVARPNDDEPGCIPIGA